MNFTNISVSGTGKETCPTRLVPTKEWKDHQLLTFSNLRAKMQALLIENEDMECSADVKRALELARDSINGAKKLFESFQPSIEIVVHISQTLWARLISRQIEIINLMIQNKLNVGETVVDNPTSMNNAVKDWLGSWIYGTLLGIRTPLEPEMHDILRKLVVALSKFRSLCINSTFDDLAWIGIPIMIISVYYNQRDLID